MRGFPSKKDWRLTESSFRRLLEWLDAGEASNGEKYLEMRRRLVAYFDSRRRPNPDDLADETLNRVARRLEEEGEIVDTAPARYCYIVAKFVFLESLRLPDKDAMPLSDLPSVPNEGPEENDRQERRLGCLEECLASRQPEDRNLILRYYQGVQREKIENRQQLAASLGLTANALAIRACRIRAGLEHCVDQCVRNPANAPAGGNRPKGGRS